MKIKIINNVVHNGKILKKDAVVNLPDKEAKPLIENKHAEEHEEEETPQDQNRQQLFKQYANASHEDLEMIKMGAEDVLAKNPDRVDAKTVIEVVTELLKKK